MRTIERALEPQELEGTAASITTPLSRTHFISHRRYRGLEDRRRIHRVYMGDNGLIEGIEIGLLVAGVGKEVGRIGEAHGSMAMVQEVKKLKVSITQAVRLSGSRVFTSPLL